MAPMVHRPVAPSNDISVETYISSTKNQGDGANGSQACGAI